MKSVEIRGTVDVLIKAEPHQLAEQLITTPKYFAIVLIYMLNYSDRHFEEYLADVKEELFLRCSRAEMQSLGLELEAFAVQVSRASKER